MESIRVKDSENYLKPIDADYNRVSNRKIERTFNINYIEPICDTLNEVSSRENIDFVNYIEPAVSVSYNQVSVR